MTNTHSCFLLELLTELIYCFMILCIFSSLKIQHCLISEGNRLEKRGYKTKKFIKIKYILTRTLTFLHICYYLKYMPMVKL